MKLLKKFLITLGILCIFVLAGVTFFYFRVIHYPDDSVRKQDVEALREGDYGAIYATMYETETASEYPIEHYMGWETYKPDHCFEKLTDIVDYYNIALEEQADLKWIFTLFDPAKINKTYFNSSVLSMQAYQKTLCKSILENTDVEFVFMLPSYSLEYWCGLNDKQIQESLDAYQLFCNEFQKYENVRIYYFGYNDWLIANPDNYYNSVSCRTEILNWLIALTIWNDRYLLTGDAINVYLDVLHQQIVQQKENPEHIYDLSKYEFVFFGDSVVGNYSGSLSIPGVITAKSGAVTYNCAIGGQTATRRTGEDTLPGFDTSVSYFLSENKEAFSTNEQFKAEVERFHSTHDSEKNLVFVVEYGLNDYFSAQKVKNVQNMYDIDTYKGGLNDGIRRLKEAYPAASFILVPPIYTDLFDNGMQRNGPQGGILTEYVDAVKELAQELNICYIDMYGEFAAQADNYIANYLEEGKGCHLGEKGRYAYGRFFINNFAKNIEY